MLKNFSVTAYLEMNPFNGFDFAIDNEFEDIVLVAQLTSDSHIIVIFDEAYASTTVSGSFNE